LIMVLVLFQEELAPVVREVLVPVDREDREVPLDREDRVVLVPVEVPVAVAAVAVLMLGVLTRGRLVPVAEAAVLLAEPVVLKASGQEMRAILVSMGKPVVPVALLLEVVAVMAVGIPVAVPMVNMLVREVLVVI